MSAPDISLIAPYPPLSGSHHQGGSGVASYTANLARALRAGGADVRVIAPIDDAGPRVEHDGEGICVERCFPLDAAGVRQAARVAADWGAPAVHLQFELFLYGGLTSLLGVLAALAELRRRDVPTVVTLHQTVDPATVDRDYTALHRVSAPAPVARVGISALQHSISRAATATIVHEEPFRAVIPGATVIPHGIERIAPVEREEARRDLGLDDRLVALCFGFLAPYKGLETALEAGERAGDDIVVVAAGAEHPRLAAGGDDYADRLRDRFGTTARFTGWVPGDDVVRWFCAADVALFPYPQPFSSSGAVALALACGTPMLLSAPLARCIGAPSDLVTSTPDALAARLRALADDPGGLADLRRWTACLADGRSWSDVAEAHLALYAEVAA